MWLLLQIDDDGHASSHRLRPGKTTLGRGRGRDVRADHSSVSRLHAHLEVTEAGVTIKDSNSRNGTFVNGRQIDRPTRLEEGDEIRCGDLPFRVLKGASALGHPELSQGLPVDSSVEVSMLSSAASDFRDSTANEQPSRRLELLRVLSGVLADTTTIDQLRDAVLNAVTSVVPADRAVFIEVEGSKIKATASRRHPPMWSSRVVAHVLDRGEAVLFRDVLGDDAISSASLRAADVRCAMAAPLVANGTVMGVLYVDTTRAADTYRSHDLSLLAIVASQASLALHNARLRQLQTTYERFFPATTVERLLEAPRGDVDVLEVEVTMLFADISGFTKMCSTRAPTDVVKMLNDYFPPMARIVFEREGMLEKYIGDALLAAWGAPFPHEDDVERALDAAIEMQAHARAMRLDIHVGIHTGPAAFANIGSV